MSIELKDALNAISDIVNNRPLPLREFDQIYMKVGDMVVHAEFMARHFNQKDIVFVGDGDAVGLSIAHLMEQEVIAYGPRTITLLDFDERMVNSVMRFAERYGCQDRISALRYNVVDALPEEMIGKFGGFHINPPWGQHNKGESVVVFLQRAVQLTEVGGTGMVVIADDDSLPWTNKVLHRTQEAALKYGLIVEQMVPALHSYHLDDAPELKSCAMGLRKIRPDGLTNDRLSGDRLENFYGRSQTLRVHYVEEIPNIAYGRAEVGSYRLVPLDGADGDIARIEGTPSVMTMSLVNSVGVTPLAND
jgi:N4-bis(aminopropyl)spermidine synthase